MQDLFLLRPSKHLNQPIVDGPVLALRGTGIEVHSFSVLSNHWPLLVSTPSNWAMAKAMRFFHGNVSKEAGLLHGWLATLWSLPCRCTEVDSDEASQVA